MASDILVGAIDFGTTYSGWAILFKHEFDSEPTKSFVRQWQSGTLTTEKTPTVVLVKPDGKTLEAFGYEAEDRYKNLVEQDEHENYFYFRRFKMMLNKKLEEKIDLNCLLEDEMGRKLPALDIFAMVIRYIVEDMHTVVKNRIVGGIDKEDVHWILTVPAIWTDAAKRFMREAGISVQRYSRKRKAPTPRTQPVSKRALFEASEALVMLQDVPPINGQRNETVTTDHNCFNTDENDVIPSVSALVEAGISSEKLSIALEPEAASIFCKNLPVSKRLDITGVSVAAFKAGTKYIVLDAGGGTMDITVHEIQRSGAVKEVIPASGGGWGGTEVDKAFEDLIIKIVGRNVYQKFKKEQMEDWLDLWRDFELKKRTVSPGNDSKIVMKFPVSLCDIYSHQNRGRSLSEAIADCDYEGKIEFTGGKLKFNVVVFRQLFEKSLVETARHIQKLLRNHVVKDVKAILMVGGFSDSPMLQQKVKSTFQEIDVIIPIDASSSILRGALIFGHSPMSITERVTKYTYGVKTYQMFEEGIDPESKRVKTDIGIRCKDRFHAHVNKGQIVKVGEPQVSQSYTPANKYEDHRCVHVYASELENPRYIDQGCTKIGEIDVAFPKILQDLNRNVLVSFTFSGTEIRVDTEDEKTRRKTYADFIFLG